MYVDMLFPTPVAIHEIDIGLCEQNASIIDNMIDSGELTINSFDGCYITTDDLNEQERFASIRDSIDVYVSNYAYNLLGVKIEDIKLECMWANIHTNNHKHESHTHPNSFISGALYLRVPETDNAGDIFFNDPRVAKNMMYADFIKQSPISDRRWIYKPKTGMLILFPSWLEHGTKLFYCESGETRISVSFNYTLKKCSSKTMRFSR